MFRIYCGLITSIINPSPWFAEGFKNHDAEAEGKSQMGIDNDKLVFTRRTDVGACFPAHCKAAEYELTLSILYYEWFLLTNDCT